MASIYEALLYLSHWRTALTMALFLLYALLLQYVIDAGVHNRRRIETTARLTYSTTVGLDVYQWHANFASSASAVRTTEGGKDEPPPYLWSAASPVCSLATVHLTQADVCGDEATPGATVSARHARTSDMHETDLAMALMYKLQLRASEADVLLLTYPEQLLTAEMTNATRCLKMQWLYEQVPLYVASTLVLWRTPAVAHNASRSRSCGGQGAFGSLRGAELCEHETRQYTLPSAMYARWLPHRQGALSTRLVHAHALECLRASNDGGRALQGDAVSPAMTAHVSDASIERAAATIVLLDRPPRSAEARPWVADSQLVTNLTNALTELYPATWTLLLLPALPGVCGDGVRRSHGTLHSLLPRSLLYYACLPDNGVSDILVGLRQIVTLDL